MSPSTKIRWGLALLGGFLAEAGVFAVMAVALRFGDQAPLYVIPPACLVMTFVFAGIGFALYALMVAIGGRWSQVSKFEGQPPTNTTPVFARPGAPVQ